MYSGDQLELNLSIESDDSDDDRLVIDMSFTSNEGDEWR